MKVAPLSDSPAGLNRFPSISSLSSTHSSLSASNRNKRIHTRKTWTETHLVNLMNLKSYMVKEREFPTMDFNIAFPRSRYLHYITLTLTGGSSPAARTNRLTFRYPLTPAERSSGSQSSSHFLKKQCPKNNLYDLECSKLAPLWALNSWTHCARCRWYRHPTEQTEENTLYTQVFTFVTGCRKVKDRRLPWIHRSLRRFWVIGSHKPVERFTVIYS